jgi:hypothetical protein
MQQIDSEINAMQQAVNGFASVARHEMISHRFANLDICFHTLSTHMGERRALEAIAQKLEEKL